MELRSSGQVEGIHRGFNTLSHSSQPTSEGGSSKLSAAASIATTVTVTVTDRGRNHGHGAATASLNPPPPQQTLDPHLPPHLLDLHPVLHDDSNHLPHEQQTTHVLHQRRQIRRTSPPTPTPPPNPDLVQVPTDPTPVPPAPDSSSSDSKPQATTSLAAVGQVQYRECLRNHAASTGGHVVDGCGEFMPAAGGGEPLRCAACDCHRNFHRREDVLALAPLGQQQEDDHHHHIHNTTTPAHPQIQSPGTRHIINSANYGPSCTCTCNNIVIPRHRDSTGTNSHKITTNHHHPPPSRRQHHSHGGPIPPPPPVMMAFHGGGAAAESSSEDLNLFHYSSNFCNNNIVVPPGLGGTTITAATQAAAPKKRYRTKFSQGQKERMQEFAERLGWKMQKQDDQLVDHFCEEAGVKRQVFKVWMHNNKAAIKKNRH